MCRLQCYSRNGRQRRPTLQESDTNSIYISNFAHNNIIKGAVHDSTAKFMRFLWTKQGGYRYMYCILTVLSSL
jgi:hypothetical protein